MGLLGLTNSVSDNRVEYDGSYEVTEAWEDKNSKLFQLIEKNGEDPEDYHTHRTSGYGSETLRKPELNDIQKKLLKQHRQKWKDHDLLLKINHSGKEITYEADPTTVINPKNGVDEEEYLAQMNKPPSSIRLVSDDAPDLRLRMIRDYNPEIYKRVNQSFHDDFKGEKVQQIEGENTGFVSEVDLYRTFWSLEQDSWFEENDLVNPTHPEHIVVDYDNDPNTPLVNEQIALLYPESDTLSQVDFDDQIIEETAKLCATEKVLGVSFSDLDWGERIVTGDQISNFDMEFPLVNKGPFYDWAVYQSRIYSNITEHQEENLTRDQKDHWVNLADEVYENVRERADSDRLRSEFREGFNQTSDGLEELPEFRNFV